MSNSGTITITARTLDLAREASPAGRVTLADHQITFPKRFFVRCDCQHCRKVADRRFRRGAIPAKASGHGLTGADEYRQQDRR